MGRPAFLAALPRLATIYGAALVAPPEELPARQSIMERHAGNPAFRAIAASVSPADAPDHGIVGFCYCFRGGPGQWWHDVVRSGLQASHGQAAADGWVEHVVEIAEVHVLPAYQGRGIGRRMLHELTAGRSERTALLSTRDAETPARRLYRSLGFSDLLTQFLFPGGGLPYAVMGAELPLARAAGSAHATAPS
ncbi:MAG TPA: N-acetyltransferase [Streptosporangiaceae bacterium]|jgi:ribosomal protein S18 acetylase RimI-like enzyme